MKKHSLPFNLGHKPLVAVPYAEFDGPYAKDTDTQYLSLGLAQWGDHSEEFPEISAKVFRHSGVRWSRQSEELPLHRPIDLTILISAALSQAATNRVKFPAGTFEKQEEALDLPMYGNLQLSDGESVRLNERLKSLVRSIALNHPQLVKSALDGCPGFDQIGSTG